MARMMLKPTAVRAMAVPPHLVVSPLAHVSPVRVAGATAFSQHAAAAPLVFSPPVAVTSPTVSFPVHRGDSPPIPKFSFGGPLAGGGGGGGGGEEASSSPSPVPGVEQAAAPTSSVVASIKAHPWRVAAGATFALVVGVGLFVKLR